MLVYVFEEIVVLIFDILFGLILYVWKILPLYLLFYNKKMISVVVYTFCKLYYMEWQSINQQTLYTYPKVKGTKEYFIFKWFVLFLKLGEANKLLPLQA